MENVKNSTATNLQSPFRSTGQTENPGSFFNDILSSSQNQLSLSGKYIKNLNADKPGNFNKAYSFVRNEAKIKRQEETSAKDIHKKSSDGPVKSDKADRYENRVPYRAAEQSTDNPSQKALNAEAPIQESEMKTPPDNNTGGMFQQIKALTKPASVSESNDSSIADPLTVVLTEQQINVLAIMIVDQFNMMKSAVPDEKVIAEAEGLVPDTAKTDILNILKDGALDTQHIMPQLQENIIKITAADQNVVNDQKISAEEIDPQIINRILESLIQENALSDDTGRSDKTRINKPLDEKVLVVPENLSKAADMSTKAIHNQLQLLKNNKDENLFSDEKSYIKDLIISDKKMSEQLMDFNSPKTLVQSSSSTGAAQPLTNRNTSFLQMVSRITEEIRLSINNSKTQMIIKLEPETLGRLTVKVSSENGIMNASFYAENDKAKTMIENNMAELRNSLEKQGIQIQNLTVTVDQNQHELNRHKNLMEAKNYSKNKGLEIKQIDEIEISTPVNPYFTQDLFNDLI